MAAQNGNEGIVRASCRGTVYLDFVELIKRSREIYPYFKLELPQFISRCSDFVEINLSFRSP